jgi:peptide deformylase
VSVIPLVTVGTAAGRRVLRTKTAPVPTAEILKLKSLASRMVEIMHAASGIGLAAPQIGRTERIAVIAHADGDFAIVNPRILRRSVLTETSEEGCLSVPGVFGDVRRSRAVTVEYWSLEGRRVRRTVRGLLARVFQHEIDHLEGVLFLDRVRRLTHGTPPPEAYATGTSPR